MIRIVLNGLNGPLEINGKSFNGSMVPWKDSLHDDEIAAVLTYVRGKTFGNNAPPVDPKRVTDVRKKLEAANRTQDVESVRAKNSGHKKKTADKWNQ